MLLFINAARKAAAAAAEARVAEEFEVKRPVDPSTPAAAPWKFNNVSIHTIEHVEPPRGEWSGSAGGKDRPGVASRSLAQC